MPVEVSLKEMLYIWLIFLIAYKVYNWLTDLFGKHTVLLTKAGTRESADAFRHIVGLVFIAIVCMTGFAAVLLATRTYGSILLSISFLEASGPKVAVEISLTDFLWAVFWGLTLGTSAALVSLFILYKVWKEQIYKA